MLVKSLLVLCVFGLLQAAHSQDIKRCTWGATFVCGNFEIAASCRVVGQCIQAWWIDIQLPPDDSSVCQTCSQKIKEARDQLPSNDTQEVSKEIFEESCSLLRFKEVVQECHNIVDVFGPELIQTLSSELNSQTVCSFAGLCNNERYFKLLAEEKAKNEALVTE